jgi:hypothetical protein
VAKNICFVFAAFLDILLDLVGLFIFKVKRSLYMLVGLVMSEVSRSLYTLGQ